MTKRIKLKSASAPTKKLPAVHDRRAADLPFNAKVFIDQVPDAYGAAEFPAYDERKGELVSQGQPTVTVIRSLRDDPLAALHAAGQIDRVQFIAGQHWQFAHIRAEIGGVKAIDPGKEAVDGGRMAEPVNDVVRKAIADLARAGRALGHEGEILVRDVLGRGWTVAKAADARGLGSEYGRKYMGRRFRECLDTLSIVYGYATRQVA